MSAKLFTVSRNGKFIGVSFAKDGLAALRHVQRNSAAEGRMCGGWLAEVVRQTVIVDPWGDAANEAHAECREWMVLS